MVDVKHPSQTLCKKTQGKQCEHNFLTAFIAQGTPGGCGQGGASAPLTFHCRRRFLTLILSRRVNKCCEVTKTANEYDAKSQEMAFLNFSETTLDYVQYSEFHLILPTLRSAGPFAMQHVIFLHHDINKRIMIIHYSIVNQVFISCFQDKGKLLEVCATYL